jgi:hypothetical protein
VQPLSLSDRVTKMPRQLTALKVGTSFGEILVVKAASDETMPPAPGRGDRETRPFALWD